VCSSDLTLLDLREMHIMGKSRKDHDPCNGRPRKYHRQFPVPFSLILVPLR
jgi:hypothetical protein